MKQKQTITTEIPEKLLPVITHLVTFFLVILTAFLPISSDTKFRIYSSALIFIFISFIFFYFASPRINRQVKYYFAYLIQIIAITLFIIFLGQIGELFIFLYFLPLIGASMSLPPKHTPWVAILATIAMVAITILFFELSGTGRHFLILRLFSTLITIWLVTIFIRFSSLRVLKEQQVSTRAQVKTQKIEEFLNLVSHELKNSLSVISAHLERIFSGKTGRLSHETRDSLMEVWETNEEINRMFRNVLKTTSLDMGKIKFVQTPINISQIISEVIKHLQPQYEKAGLYLDYQSDNLIPRVLGDPEKVEEICLNLLLNALAFTKKGGVEISHRLSPVYLWTAVKDTGVGIPKRRQRFLFKKFGPAGSGGGAGLGLGLYISARYLKRMGGKIWCESRPGIGSTFYFRLPLAKA